MSDIERNLISKILHDRDLSDVSDAGIKPAFFLDHKHRAAYEAILAHQLKYSSVPSVEAFRKDFPEKTYKVTAAADTMAYYIDQVVESYSLSLLEAGLSDAIDAYEEGEPRDARNLIAKTLRDLDRDVSGSRVADFTENMSKRLDRYRAYEKNKGALKGISSGFESIDLATGGFQPKQLITLVGPPKAGKTTIMLLATMAAHRGFYRPLFIGFEMSNEEQEERHDAIRAQVSLTRLQRGQLTREEFKKVERMTRRMSEMPPMVFTEDANSNLTLTGVAGQIERYQPDIVFVDGMYMMDDENGERKGSPQAITNLTRGFKQLAKNTEMPIVISTQVLEWKMDRKRGVTSGSIGYSSSFIQDSDQVIAVENTDDPNVKKLKIVMGRNNAGMETYVMWNWETTEFVEMEDYDADDEDSSVEKF